jgi:hypothetical protein
MRDRGFVKVDADEFRVRKRFRHQQGGYPVTATDVRHPRAAFELGDHTLERRQPVRHQMRLVTRPEEALDAAEQAVAVFAPADALAGLEGFGKPRLVAIDGAQRIKAAGHVHRAVFDREHRRLLGAHRERAGRGVIGDEAGCRL